MTPVNERHVGRDLDAALACAMYGAVVFFAGQPCCNTDDPDSADFSRAWQIVPCYSTNIADAWCLAEKLYIAAGCGAWVGGDGHTGYSAGVTSDIGRFEIEGADTAAHALCLAMLDEHDARDALRGHS